MDGGLKEKKMNIVIEIKGQQAKIVNRHEIVSGIAKLEGIEFIFSDEWDSFTKTAVIYVDEYDKTTAIKLLVENNKIEASQLPSSLFKEDCELFVGIFGDSENGQRITSTVVCQPIKEGTPVDVADEVSPDIYNQIINIMSETKALVKEATDKVEINGEYLEKASEKATDAENSANKAKEYLNAAEQNKSEVEKLTEQSKKYSESASFSAKSASESASSASISASSASQSALNAEGSATNAGTSATKAAALEKNAKASEESVKKSESNVNQAVTEFEQKRADSIAEINKTTTDSQNAINTLTTNSKKEISDLTETKKTELNKINNDITNNASSLKEAIVNAADAKKEEINQKGLEVLQSIPEDMGKIQDTTLIKSTESGTDMVLTDSSDMNIQELHLFGKSEQKTTKGIQLLNLKDAKGGTGDGVTYTPNGDGSFKKTGTATGQAGNIWLKGDYYSDWENKTPIITLEVGKSYYIKDCAIFQGQTIIASGNGQGINVTGEKYPEGIKITGIRNTGFTLNKTYNEVIYPIVAESSTAVDWEEYTGGQPSPNPDYPQEIVSVENPKLNISGKNILKQSVPTVSFDKNTKVTKLEESENKIKIKINEVGEYIYISIPLKNIIKEIKANKAYTIVFNNATQISNCFFGSGNATIKLTNYAYCKENKVVLKTLSELPNNPKQYYIYIGIYNKKGNIAGFDDITVFEGDYSNVNINSTEPYKPLQTATLNYELNGIAAIRDELIVRADGTGQLIQRLAKKIMDGSNIDASASGQQEGSYLVNIETVSDMLTGNYNVGLSTICSNKRSGKEKNTIRFGANNKNVYLYLDESFAGKTPTELRKYFVENPFTIVYPLEEPIVTELSSDEVQKILALHTNKLNTTIWNDQDAEMQITYVADTKTYIDNKMAELQALLLEKGE